jgi:hypothetical protein
VMSVFLLQAFEAREGQPDPGNASSCSERGEFDSCIL